MRKTFTIAALLLLLIGALMQRPLEAKDKDEFVQLKAELLVLQKQVRDLQESSDRSSGEISGLMKGLLTQAVDNISSTRRDIADTKQIVDRNLGEVVTVSGATSQQLTRLNERLNATDRRIEKLQEQVEAVKRFFEPREVSTNCDNGEQQYGQAYGDYLRGNYALSIDQFRNYVRCFGQTEGAGNAQYFIGDSYYKQVDYKSAAVEFDKLLRDYPNNGKAATARLKKADSLLKLDQRKEAAAELNLLLQVHPGTPEAKQAEALLQQIPPDSAQPPRRRK